MIKWIRTSRLSINSLSCSQLDGHVIEECVKAGDGKFKEAAWVKIEPSLSTRNPKP